MRPWLLLAALNGLIAVALGAYAAHGLAGHAQELAERAAQYQMYHALALLAVDRLDAAGSPGVRVAGSLFLAGIVLFSGSLALKAFTGPLALPLATPVGGACFMLGWAALAVAALRGSRR